ncbi:MAG: extracellular solute-binding protein [Clostridia bacterium]
MGHKTRLHRMFAGVLLLVMLLTTCGIAQAAENFNETGFPIVNEPVAVTAWGIIHPSATEGWDKSVFFERMQELTNIEIDAKTVSLDGSIEKRALLFASNELPDIFLRSGLTNDEIATYGAQGVLIPLQDLIEQYAPNLKALFERVEGLRGSLMTPDGNIYSLGQVQMDIPTMHYVINSQWLQNVGMEMPTDLDSFYQTLVAFKAQDANGNGDPSDEIPFSVVGIPDLKKMLSAWGIIIDKDRNNDMFVYPGTDKVLYAMNQDSFKDALTFFHKLYKEGLLDAEFLVQDATSYGAKASQNRIGTLHVPGTFAVAGEALHFDYDAMEPFPDQNGNRYTIANIPAMTGAFAITSQCKNPEAMIRWADYLYSEEGTILAWAGVEGKTYKWNDDGTWSWIPQGDESVFTLRANETLQGGAPYPSGNPDLFDGKFWSHSGNKFENSLVEKRSVAGKYAVPVFPAVTFDGVDQEEITFVMTDINNYVMQSIASFITGSVDIEAGWEDYRGTLSAMGIDRIVELYQKRYDEYQKINA